MDIPIPNPGKKKRRGGKRAQLRRKNQKERVGELGKQEGPSIVNMDESDKSE